MKQPEPPREPWARLRRIVKATRRARHRPRWGNLRQGRPFSDRFGLDRGTSLDRPYINQFIASHSDDIGGRVLEIRDRRYTTAYGRAVETSDILDIDPRNKDATIVEDLAQPGCLPPSSFDCLIVTQTLQLIPDVRRAIENLWIAMSPGGTLLISVPTLCRLDPFAGWAADYWRFPPAGLEALLHQILPEATVETSGRGNVTVAIAYLTGLAREELSDKEHRENDPYFPIVSFGRVVKPRS